MMPEPRAQATGDCYEAAFKFVSAHGQDAPDRYVLVHGNVAKLEQDEAVNHAWVEEGDIVHEVSKGRHRKFSKRSYYERYDVKNTRRYSFEEALIVSVKSGHYGPWPG
jgi:hypothetical protein